MTGLVDTILDDGVKALVRSSLSDFLNLEVKKGLITQAQAAYIEEGAADAIQLAFATYAAAKKG